MLTNLNCGANECTATCLATPYPTVDCTPACACTTC
jgi:hypothetical protein